MSARERIASLLWWQMPSPDNETARAQAGEFLDDYRAEVLAEAADFVGNDDTCDCGGCDSCVPNKLAAGLRTMAGEKASAPAPTATPDFFQAGRTYARENPTSTIRFLVKYVDDSPEGIPCKAAFGWKTEDGDVCSSPFDCDDFYGWVEVTKDGAL
ncbi:hypothetical protein [Streptomyces sp. NPDC004324]